MPQSPPSSGGAESGILRLQARIARSGVASRRAAEALILAGRVTVNGARVVELGTKVGPADRVTVDGREIFVETGLRHLVLNKPRGFLSAMSDPEGRPLAVSLIRPYVKERVYNIGRLDQWSQGLILFTNDGDFAAIVGHPSSEIEKEYEVEAADEIPPSLLVDFVEGLTVDGQRYRAKSARPTGQGRARIVLVEGRNREIRRVFASRGVHVSSLLRVRIGPVEIAGLGEGSFRELTRAEIDILEGSGRA